MKALLGIGIAIALGVALRTPAAAQSPSLTNLAQIVAFKPVPGENSNATAQVRGVVIYVSPPTRRLYIQEDTNGVQVNVMSPVTEFRVGQLVEVTGTVAPALPRPGIVRARAAVLDDAPLPDAPFVSPHRLGAGREAFRFVTTRGFVRDMVTSRSGLTLWVTYEGVGFEVTMPPVSHPLPREWLDAEIEVRGLSYPFFNVRDVASSFRFHTPTTNFIRVLKPGPGQFTERPMLTIAEAAAKPQAWGPRYRFSGTVTYSRANVTYVQDDTGVMLVIPFVPFAKPSDGDTLDHDKPSMLQPGDRIEVLGVRHNWYSLVPTMIFSEWRRAGQGPLPKAIPASVRDLQAGRHAGRVVSIEGRLLNQRAWGNSAGQNQLLMLQSGEEVVQASWTSELPVEWKLKPDSHVRVTGVHESEGGVVKGRPTFQILMRSPADVVEGAAPPFWTQPKIWKPSLAAGVVGLLSAGWILMLRGQVHRRTAELRNANAEVARALDQERELSQLKSSFVSMVSHEFRTPLEVILSSSNILDRYFERLPADKRKAQLRAIRRSVHRMNDLVEDVLMLGKFDAGRMACSAVTLDLNATCRRLVGEAESAANREGAIQFRSEEVNGDASADETLLVHILGNLLGNALKYSPTDSPVDFLLTRHGPDAEFIIRDRGCGIPANDQAHLFTAFCRGANVSHTPGTGLGLAIVKRCVDLHGGAIHCESKEGQGTTFTVTLPLFDGRRHFHPQVSNQTQGPV